MKKLILVLFICGNILTPCYAFNWSSSRIEERAVEKLLKTQIKYANKNDFKKFINTYDPKYINSDGFNLDVYSNLVKDIWNTYSDIEYGIKIKKIEIDNNKATVNLIETSQAEITLSKVYKGILESKADSVYNLEKINGKWKVVSDSVLDETTTMLYGEARDLEIKLTVPTSIEANTDYVAALEFTPPKETIAIASLASDIIEYPQKPTKEVFRPMPEDNILERFFTSNNKKANEYIVASIGLTKTEISDLSLKLNLTGFGYAIRRVNVIPKEKGVSNE